MAHGDISLADISYEHERILRMQRRWPTAFPDIDYARDQVERLHRDYRGNLGFVPLPFPAVVTDLIGMNKNRVALTLWSETAATWTLSVVGGPFGGGAMVVTPDMLPVHLTVDQFGLLVQSAFQGASTTVAVNVTVMEHEAR